MQTRIRILGYLQKEIDVSKQNLRTTVDADVHAELQARADAAGVSLFIYARQVLTEHAAVAAAVTPLQWTKFRTWVISHPGALADYAGPNNYKDPAARSVVVAWARDHGYTE